MAYFKECNQNSCTCQNKCCDTFKGVKRAYVNGDKLFVVYDDSISEFPLGTAGAETPFTATSSDGSVTIIPGGVNGHAPNLTVNFPTIPVQVITTLVNNNNGTATYTNEAGVAVTIPLGVEYTPRTELFFPADGANTIALTLSPIMSRHIVVYRNGSRELSFTTSGNVLTFLLPFDNSGGASFTEQVIVDYYSL